MQINRLYFIDAVRAFAILMMLQGHFIDTLLAVEFRDPNNWHTIRGAILEALQLLFFLQFQD